MNDGATPRIALELFIGQGFPEVTFFEGTSLSAADFSARLIRVLPEDETFLSDAQRTAVFARAGYEDETPPEIVTFRNAAVILWLLFHEGEAAAYREIEGLRPAQPLVPVPPGGEYPRT